MPLKTHHDEQPSLNLTPMIDIVFLLIIFFMVGTQFTEPERKLKLEVPSVSNANLSAAPEKKVVNVYRNGQVELDRKIVTLEQLTSKLAAARSQYRDLGVLVRGDAQASNQTMVSVLVACKRAGVSKLAQSVLVTSGRN